jgi:hypothetical protein
MGFDSLQRKGDQIEFGSHEFPAAAFSEKKNLSLWSCQVEIDWIVSGRLRVYWAGGKNESQKTRPELI